MPSLHDRALSSLSVAELKAELSQRGAPTTGAKAVLVARLRSELAKPQNDTRGGQREAKRQKTVDGTRAHAATATNGSDPSSGKQKKPRVAVATPSSLTAKDAKPAVAHESSAPTPVPASKRNGHGKSGGGAGKSSMKQMVVKGRAAVDSYCSMAAELHVYEAEKSDEVYDALLNQTDINKNSNKFYVIQLLETDSSPHKYYLWTRWGRVGERGQNALQRTTNLAEATTLFLNKFRDKTKNDWRERSNFEPVPGKYTLIEVDYGVDDDPLPAVKQPSKSNGSSSQTAPLKPTIDDRIADLVSLVCDVKLMEASMKEIGFDAERMPLGKLKRSTILQGYSVLKELSELIVGPKAIQRSGSATATSSASASRSSGKSIGGSTPQAILDLSNRFYSLIPHVSTDSAGQANRLQRLPPIDNPALLKSKIEMVESLGEIELASRVIDTRGGAFDRHPVDIRYEQLGVTLSPIDVGSSLHNLLVEYMHNTHAETHSQYELHLEQAFEIVRPGEAESFRNVGNRMLLWHGSRITNWAGILSQGLRIAPPEAPVTGYMFDKGVYFADMVSKSANYCFTSRSSPTGVLMLCDVALGKQFELLQAEYRAASAAAKKGQDSVWGRGATGPDPKGTVSHPGDPALKVPMGRGAPTGVKRSALLYNEYVVYDTRQIKQKYVLKVHFKHR